MRWLSWLLAMVVMAGCGTLWAAGGDLPGGGTEGDPYLIEDLADFDVFADSVNAATYWARGVYTRLACDPNLAGRVYEAAVIAPHTPTWGSEGFQGTEFCGVFDGQGHVIENVVVSTIRDWNQYNDVSDYLGLFGKIGEGGAIRNLRLENSTTEVGDEEGEEAMYIGGLCGKSEGVIENCHVTGEVAAGNDSWVVGLLCGESAGLVKDCHTEGKVTCGESASHIGGLIGLSYYLMDSHTNANVTVGDRSEAVGGLCGSGARSTTNSYAVSNVFVGAFSRSTGVLLGRCSGVVDGCYAKGSIAGVEVCEYFGGLCGLNYSGVITNCYSLVSIDTSAFRGGRPGNLCGDNWGVLANCYTAGDVVGQGAFEVAGLCWNTSNEAVVLNCYFLETCGVDNGFGVSLSAAQMQDAESFLKFDFIGNEADGLREIWQIPIEGGYPELGHFLGYEPYELAGNGTEDDPYMISSRRELMTMHHYPCEAYFALADDIDLSGVVSQTALVPDLLGVFDGNGFSIQNMTLRGGGSLGLFSLIGVSGAVRDLRLENVDVDGGSYVGGICGKNYGLITGCSLDGVINGSGKRIGGLCGLSTGAIRKCSVDGSVAGNRCVGGLVGDSVLATVSESYSNARITAVAGGLSCRSFGGLIGTVSGGLVTDSYATGAVSGDIYVGGLAGSSTHGTFQRCYATGTADGMDYVGGFVGYSHKGDLSISGSFWDVDTSGIGVAGDDNYGATGKTTEQMETESTFTDADWDFTNESANGDADIWRLCVDRTDYPRLAWGFGSDYSCPDGVSMEDLFYLSSRWLESGLDPYTSADRTGDGVVNLEDHGLLADQWMREE